MGEEKVSEYEQISDPDGVTIATEELASDWPQDVELGAMNPAEVPDEDDDPQETPADDGDKTSAIVFDDDEDDNEEEF